MREDQAFAMDQAIERGDEAALEALLINEPRLTGTPIPVPQDWGEEMWLGLHRAAESGSAGLVRLLLDAGASVDARTRFRTPMHGRSTPLILASRCGHREVVALLMERHAEADLLDANHRSALSYAAEAGHSEIVDHLVGVGCELDPVDDQGRTPLHWAIAGGYTDAALALIKAGADVNHRCPKESAGYTPLHRCATVGQAMDVVADRLKQAGADATLRDPRFGKTAAELPEAPSALS
ncbi:MAG: ankyrin repeat domain-containing protein [Phycisphaeraceae bacterium]